MTTSVKQLRLKISTWLLCVIALNISLYYFIPIEGQGVSLDGQLASEEETSSAFLRTYLIGLPFLGLILGALISLIPYQKKKYQQKYLTVTLYTILSLEVLFLIMRIVGLFIN